ncbi:FtsX-like permease family protein [Streptomyces sp. TRM64462]|uniref:FtsX-like permease family protein n=1 Tax=Streptomyces sp. TRM64462 TaxID=2741726 RepID=UPI001586D19C|nr:FtsX-like permease family protein [Streptomyces sp. TRM64462]
MFGLALQTLKFRKGGFLASFVALFFGATILMACGALMETGIRSAVPPQRFAAAPVVVTGEQTFDGEALPERARIDAALAQRLAALPGVDQALTDVSFPAAAVKGADTPPERGLTGHGWSSARLTGAPLADGSEPRAPGETALDQRLADRLGVRPGDRVTLAVAGGSEQLRVTGVLRPATGTETAFYVTDTEAARLSGTDGQSDAIAVLPAAGTSTADAAQAVKEALRGTPARTLTGDARGEAEFPEALAASVRLISMSAVFGGIAVMVSVFVVGSTLALLIQQRLREMAMLRAIGSLPAQIRRMVTGETLVIASGAILLAVVPGWFAGRWMLDQLAGGGVVAPEVAYRAGWVPVIVAAGASVASAVAAASIASRRAANARPADAMAESAVQSRWLSGPRLLFALLCLGGGTALALVTALVMDGPLAAATSGPAAMLWAGGIALLSPGITRVLTAVLQWPLRAFSGFPGRLAMDNARARRIRVAGAVTPVMLATGLATSLIYMQTGQAAAAQDAESALIRADAVVTSSVDGLKPDMVEKVAALPGVAAASAYAPGAAYIVLPLPADEDPGEEPDTIELTVRAVSGAGAAGTLTPKLTEGSFEQLRGDTVVLPTTVTGEPGNRVGDTVDMVIGDGTRLPVKVVGSYEAQPGFETAFLPAELAIAHTDTGLVPQILVSGDDGTTTAELLASLRTLAADGPPGLVVADRATVEAAADDSATSTWINYLLAGTIIGYAVISLVNTLIVAAAERRREFALQRLVGASEGQIMRMMTVESILVALMGTLLGTVVAVATLAPFGIGLDGSWLPRGPVWIYLAVIGFAGALALVTTLLPTRLALRNRPAEVLAVA